MIEKRDGRIVPFDKQKITNAILRAMSETDDGVDDWLAGRIADEVEHSGEHFTVEEVQDKVEEALMESERKDVARKYVIYRNDRNRARSRNSKIMKLVETRINATAVENQNANVDEYSFGGRFGAVASEVLKQYALDELVSKMARDNHINNEIYIHDLDHYALGDHNCLSIPFDDLLAKGFNTRQTDVRPAQSISTAFQLVAVIFQLQSLQQFGGVGATHIDWTMVPYVRKSFMKHFKEGLKYVEGKTDEEIEEIVNKILED